MRRKLLTLAVLLGALAVGSVLVVVLGDGASGAQELLKVEQATTPDGGLEVLVTVPTDINVPATAGGATTVLFECVNSQGEVVIGSRQGWPLASDGDPPAPHVHQPVSPRQLSGLSTCRFPETKPRLEGRVGLAR